jgi:predicted esterase
MVSDLTFSQLLTQAAQFYQSGEYAQALDLITREAGRFPTEARRTYCWRVCMASLINETELALRLLEEAVAGGLWYPETQLREDPDLLSLQGLPQFEQLVELCRQRQAEAQAQAVPTLTVLEPEGGCRDAPLLLALHGNNQNVESSIGFWRSAVSRGWLLALLQSSQASGPGIYAWNDRDWALREIQAHYARLREQYAVDPNRVVVAGFSMGGEVAIWLALTAAIQVRGFIAVGPGGPYIQEPDNWAPLIEASREREARGYLIVGEQDIFCYSGTQALATLLSLHDIPYELEVHPRLGHEFPPEFEQSLSRALQFIG